jgi:uncharacterized protein
VKFTEHKASGDNQFSSASATEVMINGQSYKSSLWLSAHHIERNWPFDSVQSLTVEAFEGMTALSPEVILLGSGGQFSFPQASVMRALRDKGVALDVMDTKACCRTYNVLTSEGRHVVAAIIIEPSNKQNTQ